MTHANSSDLSQPRWAPWAALLGLAAVLFIGSWSLVEGTPTADVVEYLERAQALVRGEKMVDAHAIRAIGVSLIHAPVLWLADLIGIGHGPWILAWAGMVHLVISGLLIVGAVRLGRSMARAASLDEERAILVGWVSGFATLASPAFVQYAAIPMTDISAGAAFAFGLDYAIFRGRYRLAGTLLGLSALCAFKAIPLVVLAVFIAVAATWMRDGIRKALGAGAELLVPIALLALLQCATDRITYGVFGESLRVYLLANLGPIVVSFLAWAGMDGLAERIYLAYANIYGRWNMGDLAETDAAIKGMKRLMLQLHYFQWFIARVMVPFGVLAAVVGTYKAWVSGASTAAPKKAKVGGNGPTGEGPWLEPETTLGERLAGAWHWARTRLGPAATFGAPALISAAFIGAVLMKGSIETRILMPVLAPLAGLSGLGLVLFAGPAGGQLARPRSAIAALALGAGIAQCIFMRTEDPPSHPANWFGPEQAAFARAAKFVRELPVPEGASGKGKVASSYHWAVLFRTPGDWELTKLPHQLDGLGNLNPEERQAAHAAILEQDTLIVHASLLRVPMEAGPWATELFDVIAENFHVAAAFWERKRDTGFGPVLVLTKEPPAGETRRSLWRSVEAPPAGALSGAVEPGRLRLTRILGDVTEIVEVTGVRGARLPGDGLFWVEVDLDHRTPRLVARHYGLHLDVRDGSGRGGYASLRRPSWQKRDLQDIAEGTRITEGFLLSPRQGPQNLTQPASAIADGEPVTVWFDIGTHHRDEAGNVVINGRLEAMDPPRGDHAERDDPETESDSWIQTNDGFRYSKATGALLIGTFERVPAASGQGWALRLEGALEGE